MSKTCIIIEDQPPAQRILQKYIADLGTLELKGVFSDALTALTFLQKNTIDLIFLDIHLPKISGIDFLKTINNPPKTILTTAFSEFALESYEYNVVDYLLKPFSFQRFIQAVTKASYETKTTLQSDSIVPKKEEDFFFIKSGYDLFKVSEKEIMFITADSDYTQVKTKNKSYLSSETLKQWKEKLNDSLFCQVHKSYIINIRAISKLSGNQIYIEEERIPVGRVYKEDFERKIGLS
ncbi:DNA-binding LytR/AlgR family response regulator [Aquimarina sp. EL_43]|uniref:LytR/AlgR family response regulator transcription factor n=1 Tax=unclassified Aquimarina TaxID=2627091 RepID=UPI0018CAF6F5|nr:MULTISPECIES: LytTR family DNA-binding domain-containing protein [unclassified Aquimarina]MBG6129467.1 DNA-binding LytR/AlgR family response regulator [Aquimarina sp. EL_35]MBG6150532.1 DNA-binding LytR/AlgR family response regulator [Aquimarina sp. EL_32]MBG6168160.1 DNA-binding LytR/AlgR family response regulator [Aquimarina sp. EL_43]